jgi:hypothetical protein
VVWLGGCVPSIAGDSRKVDAGLSKAQSFFFFFVSWVNWEYFPFEAEARERCIQYLSNYHYAYSPALLAADAAGL